MLRIKGSKGSKGISHIPTIIATPTEKQTTKTVRTIQNKMLDITFFNIDIFILFSSNSFLNYLFGENISVFVLIANDTLILRLFASN